MKPWRPTTSDRAVPCSETLIGPLCKRGIAGALLAALSAFSIVPTHADQDQIHREMIETLDAYALQKMGRDEEAFALWLELAKKGNGQGMLNVANMYQAGEGVEADPATALEWYLKAGEQGDSFGLFSAAEAYDKGLGTPRDEGRALKLYRRAAQGGSTEAQRALADKLMADGEPEQAQVWLERANAAGDPVARQMLADLGVDSTTKTDVTDDQLFAVQELLKDLDAAANARDAAALTRPIASQARIQVTLPNRPGAGAQVMTPAAYRRLWRATFAKTDRYRFSRLGFDVAEQGSQLRVMSRIRETFSTRAHSSNLHLDETLLVSIDAEQPVITAVNLVVKGGHRSSID